MTMRWLSDGQVRTERYSRSKGKVYVWEND
jgi:hypothetical protein